MQVGEILQNKRNLTLNLNLGETPEKKSCGVDLTFMDSIQDLAVFCEKTN
jgi:hypothetical protein